MPGTVQGPGSPGFPYAQASPPAPRGRAAVHRRPRPSTRAGSGRKSSRCGLRRRCRYGSRRGAAARSAGRRADRTAGGRNAALASLSRVGQGRAEELWSRHNQGRTTQEAIPRPRAAAFIGRLAFETTPLHASATPPQNLFASVPCWLQLAAQSVRASCPTSYPHTLRGKFLKSASRPRELLPGSQKDWEGQYEVDQKGRDNRKNAEAEIQHPQGDLRPPDPGLSLSPVCF